MRQQARRRRVRKCPYLGPCCLCGSIAASRGGSLWGYESSTTRDRDRGPRSPCWWPSATCKMKDSVTSGPFPALASEPWKFRGRATSSAQHLGNLARLFSRLDSASIEGMMEDRGWTQCFRSLYQPWCDCSGPFCRLSCSGVAWLRTRLRPFRASPAPRFGFSVQASRKTSGLIIDTIGALTYKIDFIADISGSVLERPGQTLRAEAL